MMAAFSITKMTQRVSEWFFHYSSGYIRYHSWKYQPSAILLPVSHQYSCTIYCANLSSEISGSDIESSHIRPVQILEPSSYSSGSDIRAVILIRPVQTYNSRRHIHPVQTLEPSSYSSSGIQDKPRDINLGWKWIQTIVCRLQPSWHLSILISRPLLRLRQTYYMYTWNAKRRIFSRKTTHAYIFNLTHVP